MRNVKGCYNAPLFLWHIGHVKIDSTLYFIEMQKSFFYFFDFGAFNVSNVP